MSTIVETKPEFGKNETMQILDKWDKLASLFEHGTDEVIADLKKDLELDEICVNGFTNGLTCEAKLKGSESEQNMIFDTFLQRIGFTREEVLFTQRLCVVNGCTYQTGWSLGQLMNHMIGHHKIPIKTLGRLVPVIKNDTRKPLEGFARVKNNFQNIHMNTE